MWRNDVLGGLGDLRNVTHHPDPCGGQHRPSLACGIDIHSLLPSLITLLPFLTAAMSQSPLARKRKSLTAFSRAPSQLSRSTTTLDAVQDVDSSPSSAPSRSPEQNAFATPTRERKSRRESERFDERDSRSSPSRETPSSRHRQSLGSDFTPGFGTPTPSSRPHRIVYSPYATPPAGLSRSSSIPFDMAASAAAARKTEQRLRSAGPRQSLPLGEKKPRFVRRKALWQR